MSKEYINRELLENALEDENKNGNFVFTANWIMEIIDNLPTADVVPKSEVDKAYARGFERGKKANVCGFSAEEIAQKAENLAIELDAMRGAANSYKMHYENERQEVARAICCEIEKEIVAALESNYRALKEWDDGRCNDYILEMVNRVKGKIDALRGIEGFVEELKKKYTE